MQGRKGREFRHETAREGGRVGNLGMRLREGGRVGNLGMRLRAMEEG